MLCLDLLPNFEKVILVATADQWEESIERKGRGVEQEKSFYSTDSYRHCISRCTHLRHTQNTRIYIYLYIALQETSNSFFVNRQQQNIAIIRSDDNDDIIIFVLDLHRLIHGLHLLSLNTEDQKYWVGKHSNHISYKGTQFHPKAYTYKWDKIYHSIHLHTSGIFVWSGEVEDKNLGLEWMVYKIIPITIKM